MKSLWQRRKKWIIAGGAILLIILIAAVAAPLLMRPPGGSPGAAEQVPGGPPGLALAQRTEAESTADMARVRVTTGDLTSEISAGGQIVAQQSAALSLPLGGTVAEAPVEVGDVVRAGDALLQLETTDLERAVAQAEQALLAQEASLAALVADPPAADLAAAEAAVLSAQVELDDLLNGPSASEIAAAEADLRAAQADLAAASARLSSATAAPDEAALRAAQIELDLAQAAATTAAEQHSTILVTEPNQFLDAETLADLELQARARAQQANADLAAAQEAYDALVNGDPASVTARQASVASAAAQRDAAQAQLDLLQAGPTSSEIAAARSSLAQAEEQLEQLRRGPAEATRVAAEVGVERARIQQQRAEQNLAEATLVAPFDGVVTAVNVRPGETASGVVVEMVDLNSLEVALDVDEVDIAQVARGEPAAVTLETWPDDPLTGEVTAIVPQPVAGSDLVVYRVYLSLAETDLPLRAGMTADATLTTGELTDVLLLPSEAIQVDRDRGTYRVQRVTSGPDGAETVEVVEISVGQRSGGFTQVTGGLEAGDEVLIDNGVPVRGVGAGNGGGPFGGRGN